jgi:site-specific DNA-methyltransferase (adenine-specific)
MDVNKLILGDNLEILKAIDNDTIDLIYLDPPFFSNRNYEVIWGDEGEVRSFQDR